MASTLYLQMPPRALLSTTESLADRAIPFCLASSDKNILQQGAQTFAELSALAGLANQLVLLVSASDVNMIDVEVPPMPMAKLKLALSSILEEQVLTDVADLLLVPSTPVNGRCQVAVVAKAWMELIYAEAKKIGINNVSAFAVSQTLPFQEGVASVAVEVSSAEIEQLLVLVKTGPNAIAGLNLDSPVSAMGVEQSYEEIWKLIRLLVPESRIALYVGSPLQAGLSNFLAPKLDEAGRVDILPLDWKAKIAAIGTPLHDLLSSMIQSTQQAFDWQRWRWSVRLAGAIVFFGLLGLNWESWRLGREESAMSNSLISSYKAVFPNDTVIRDPLLQMQMKINVAKKVVGQSSSDDFLVLASQFGQAWDQVTGGQTLAASIEYKDHTLEVTPKTMGGIPLDKLKSALLERHLRLDVKDNLLKISVEIGGAR